VVFDKTGTLTKGTFVVDGIYSEEGWTKDELLRFTALAESLSNHPIAQSVVKAWGGETDRTLVADYVEIPGKGISAKVEGREVLCGNLKLMAEHGIAFKPGEHGNAALFTAVGGKPAGVITLSDEVKAHARDAIAQLKSMGVKKTVMLTGDAEDIARRVGSQLNIDEVYAGLLPQDKVAILEKLEKEKSRRGTVVFTGDGINDAPVLARADVGIAMGCIGSDAAVEAADVVLMQDEPSKIAEAIKISRRTRSIVVQNIILALAVKAVVLLLGAGGLANLWEAVFADVGVALLAVLNAMRALKN
jgi:Zn2+/Cd2+-exporting ATPase